MALMVPSFIAPSRTCISISCRGDDAVMDSLLEKISIEGFFVFHVTKAGYISDTELCFAPNPPPILGFDTLIFDFGIPRAFAMILLQ